MSRFLRPACAPPALLIACAVALFGCGTREDRTITFSTEGGRVAFQHGREGVFVADKEGGGLKKIFTPAKDVIAVGTPLWAPNDRRLIFATVSAPPGAAAAAPTEAEPEGRVFARQPGVYTCWLRDEPKGGVAPEPKRLFTAQVADVGYVAAGLAVRWHPKGDRVLYVERGGAGHVVSEFDLASKKSCRVSPDVGATDLVFDWSPDGTHLACVVAETPGQKDDGIWVRGEGDWWHVAESTPLNGRAGAGLEILKASRPKWTKDGRRFAFVTSLPGKADGDPAISSLWSASLKGRLVRRIFEEKRPLRDLAWHPEGGRLGFAAGGDEGTLRVTDLDREPATVTKKPVRSFTGWDAKGRLLAYTTAEEPTLPDKNDLCLLLISDPLARDVLWVAPGTGTEPGRAVVSGLRTTFARWSPTEDRLSQWFTFSPPHRSIFSGGLRRGDPAAVIDAKTGAISWMAVDADEMAQVGHYHLMKRKYAEAWSWYERAEREGKPEPAAAPAGGQRPFRDFSFFAYYCLEKLGRGEEARTRLAAFRKRAPALLPVADPNAADPALRNVGALLPLARDLYAAQVFLSLDAAEDGEAFFRRALDEAKTDDDRLSAAVALSQILLLRCRYAEYADLATKTVAPLVLRAWQPGKGGDALKQWTAQPLPVLVASLSLFPLGRAELLAALPKDRLGALAERWTALRAKAPDDLSRLGADIVLEGLYRKLGRDAEAKETHKRISSNPLGAGRLWNEEEIKSGYLELREALKLMGIGPVSESWRAGSVSDRR